MWVTGFGWSRVEALVEGCLQMKVELIHSEEAPLIWVLRKRGAQWTGDGDQMGTLGLGYKAALWGCHDGTGGAAAIRIVAKQFWTLGLLDLG